ncbi:MAG: anthranilate phosphoribosyltransferase [Thermoleophilaceae bacterium]|nr:anthranilate phosphoribosyltransferase [Thermoleophilaceae bacterium]
MPNPVLTTAIDRLASGRALSAEVAAEALRTIMEGDASEVQTAAFLIALRTKGETVDELTGLAQTMRELSLKVVVSEEAARDGLLDTAGTGGGRPTANVSTTAALVAAGAGCRVAKHGNRSSTGLSGSADLLEALGVRIDLEPAAIAECIEEIGFGFMFAPRHHAAMRHVVPVRKELGVRTVFNFVGPITNPAGASCQVIGVSDPAFRDTLAGALGALGGRRALVVSSEDGLDEISASAPTRVTELNDGERRELRIVPEELGVEPAAPDALGAGTAEQNAEIARAVLAGDPGPERSVTLLNAGAAIYVAGRADDLTAGVRAAEAAIDSGAAAEVLERYAERSRRLVLAS